MPDITSDDAQSLVRACKRDNFGDETRLNHGGHTYLFGAEFQCIYYDARRMASALDAEKKPAPMVEILIPDVVADAKAKEAASLEAASKPKRKTKSRKSKTKK